MSAHEGEGEQTPQQMGEIHPLGDIGELNLNSLDTKIFQMALAISANIWAHTIVCKYILKVINKDWLKFQLGDADKYVTVNNTEGISMLHSHL